MNSAVVHRRKSMPKRRRQSPERSEWPNDFPHLPMRPSHQLFALRWGIGPQAVEERAGVRLDDDRLPVGFGQEPFAHRVVQKAGQSIEVSLDVEDAGWLRVNPQLAPGQDLEESLQRSDSTRECYEP